MSDVCFVRGSVHVNPWQSASLTESRAAICPTKEAATTQPFGMSFLALMHASCAFCSKISWVLKCVVIWAMHSYA